MYEIAPRPSNARRAAKTRQKGLVACIARKRGQDPGEVAAVHPRKKRIPQALLQAFLQGPAQGPARDSLRSSAARSAKARELSQLSKRLEAFKHIVLKPGALKYIVLKALDPPPSQQTPKRTTTECVCGHIRPRFWRGGTKEGLSTMYLRATSFNVLKGGVS